MHEPSFLAFYHSMVLIRDSEHPHPSFPKTETKVKASKQTYKGKDLLFIRLYPELFPSYLSKPSTWPLSTWLITSPIPSSRKGTLQRRIHLKTNSQHYVAWYFNALQFVLQICTRAPHTLCLSAPASRRWWLLALQLERDASILLDEFVHLYNGPVPLKSDLKSIIKTN